ncbi:MAG TPA: 2OG-Fe(II) oxygenase [Pirellulales bacterium]|nr:2OG-Fe(II) oxygenase [Pirellulales bacterium]
MGMLDLAALSATPLVREPFEYVVVPGFVKPEVRERVNEAYPRIERPGSFPLSELEYEADFARLMDELNGEPMRTAFERKFDIDLTGRPTMITVRGRAGQKDGRIHTDTASKIITVLIYMNSRWEAAGGRLRLLRSADDLDDMILEIPPEEGTLLAFRRSENSFHGHKPFIGERRVIQFNWITDQKVVDRELKRHRFSAWTKRVLSFAGSRGGEYHAPIKKSYRTAS